MKAHTKQSQAAMTPETSLQALKDGNERFITATQVVRDLNAQVEATSTCIVQYGSNTRFS